MTIIRLATLKTKQNKAKQTTKNVTTLPHRGRVGPPPSTGAVQFSFRTELNYGGGRDVQHRHTAKKTKPPNPPPVGKAGFEVWVLTKAGLVSVQTTADCTVP